MITLLSELTKEDFYQFSYYTNWSASWNFRKRLIYHSKNIIFGATLAFLFFYLIGWKIHFLSFIAGGIFLLLFNFLILPIWIRHDHRKYVEKFYSNPSNSNFFLKTELVIDEKGVQAKDDVSTTLHSWLAFVKKSETEKYFYLYLSAQMALVIPKRIFGSEKEKVEFKKMLLTHFPLLSDLQSLNKEAI